MESLEFKEFKTLVLDKIRIGFREQLDLIVLQDIQVDVISDLITNKVICQIRAMILGNRNVCKVEHHTTLWQEAREKILPKFWLKKHPSKKKAIIFSVTYPTINYASEDHRPYVTFVQNNI